MYFSIKTYNKNMKILRFVYFIICFFRKMCFGGTFFVYFFIKTYNKKAIWQIFIVLLFVFIEKSGICKENVFGFLYFLKIF